MPKRQQGFTLLEIMVALAVGGIAITSLYAVGSASTRQFRQQGRISATQTSLRAAMDQLKHDVQRAGFLTTPNVSVGGEACAQPSTTSVDPTARLAAIYGYTQAATLPSKLDPSGLNASTPAFFTVDQLWLTGNYATSGEYPGISIGTDRVTITVPMLWQSFQRDFVGWTGINAGNCDANAFGAAFPVGRLVRLHGLNDVSFYSRVSRTNCVGQNSATITIADSIPTSCNLDNGWVAPVSMMRYSVVDATANEDNSDARMTVLRRTEVQPYSRATTLTATVGSVTQAIEDRALLDYVVRFNVSFLMRINTSNTQLNFAPATASAVLTNPERVRAAIIDVAVRTAQQEFDFLSSVPNSAFKIYATPGAARIRRARAEVLIPNLAGRRL